MLVKSSYELDSIKSQKIARYIIRMVFELSKYFYNANSEIKQIIINHISESYEYECNLHNKLIPVEQYISEMEKSIGWDWVLPEKQ